MSFYGLTESSTEIGAAMAAIKNKWSEICSHNERGEPWCHEDVAQLHDLLLNIVREHGVKPFASELAWLAVDIARWMTSETCSLDWDDGMSMIRECVLCLYFEREDVYGLKSHAAIHLFVSNILFLAREPILDDVYNLIEPRQAFEDWFKVEAEYCHLSCDFWCELKDALGLDDEQEEEEDVESDDDDYEEFDCVVGCHLVRDADTGEPEPVQTREWELRRNKAANEIKDLLDGSPVQDSAPRSAERVRAIAEVLEKTLEHADVFLEGNIGSKRFICEALIKISEFQTQNGDIWHGVKGIRSLHQIMISFIQKITQHKGSFDRKVARLVVSHIQHLVNEKSETESFSRVNLQQAVYDEIVVPLMDLDAHIGNMWPNETAIGLNDDDNIQPEPVYNLRSGAKRRQETMPIKTSKDWNIQEMYLKNRLKRQRQEDEDTDYDDDEDEGVQEFHEGDDWYDVARTWAGHYESYD